MTQRILLIEPAAPTQAAVATLDADLPAHLERTSWARFEEDRAAAPPPDLIVAVDVPETAVFSNFLDSLRSHAEWRPVLGILSESAPASRLRTVSQTLDDFVLWPAHGSEIACRIRRLLGASERPREGSGVERQTAGATDAEGLEHPAMRELVGQSAAFCQALARIPRVAHTDAPVLITGETGTGKELAARAIHHLSPRRSGPFVPVDCSAMPENLFENEMFGHERGAFTDAHRRREGLVALAAGGTLFLDEVDSLGLGIQAKLLRLLQEKAYRPLGGDRFLRADVRVLSASNRDLARAVAGQQLRADLFYRLDVLRLHLPPLRERNGDVLLLADRFLRELAPPGNVPKTLSPAAARRLALYGWPGNVRELWTAIQRAWVASSGSRIEAADIDLPTRAADPSDWQRPFRDARAAAVAAFEREYVEDMLRRHAGNVTRAAREARAERRSFGRLAKKYGLRPRDGGETSGAVVS